MKTIKFNYKEKEIEFRGLTINEDMMMEFKTCSNKGFGSGPFVVLENKGGIKSDKYAMKIPEEIMEKLIEVKREFASTMKTLYVDIISGREELMLLEIGLDDYPYLVTTETILEHGEFSPKYNRALEFAFSEMCFSHYGINGCPNFNDFSDLQRGISKAAKGMNLQTYEYKGEKVRYTTFKDLLGRI